MKTPMQLSLAMTALAFAQLNAQQAASCSSPGAAFGVTSYQCASCSIKQNNGARASYVFQAEPVVLEVSTTSVFKPGDVIEAVNGDPIMTQAGADRFTYPPVGPTSFTVRRGKSRMQLSAIALGCVDNSPADNPARPMIIVDGNTVQGLNSVDPKTIESIEVLKGNAASVYGPRAVNGVIVIKTKPGTRPKGVEPSPPKSEPLYIVDGVVVDGASKTAGFPSGAQPNAAQVDTNLSVGGKRFGFAIGCVPSCTQAKATDGTEYYKFDRYPAVVALTPGGPAALAGVRVGDVVTQIDGKSILGEDGALRFVGGNKTETLHVTVMRDGSTFGYLLKAR